MKVFIDGTEEKWDFPSSHNLKEAILQISERLLSHDGKVIAELKLGDTENDVDMKLTPEQVPVSKVKTIFLTTEPLKDSLMRDVRSAAEKLQETLDLFNTIPDHLVAGEIDIAMEKLRDAVDTLIWSFSLLQQTFDVRVIDMHTFTIGTESIGTFIAGFNEKLKVLTDAMENKDHVLINDYLEYEIAPAVLALKESLPQIKEILRGWN